MLAQSAVWPTSHRGLCGTSRLGQYTTSPAARSAFADRARRRRGAMDRSTLDRGRSSCLLVVLLWCRDRGSRVDPDVARVCRQTYAEAQQDRALELRVAPEPVVRHRQAGQGCALVGEVERAAAAVEPVVVDDRVR